MSAIIFSAFVVAGCIPSKGLIAERTGNQDKNIPSQPSKVFPAAPFRTSPLSQRLHIRSTSTVNLCKRIQVISKPWYLLGE